MAKAKSNTDNDTDALRAELDALKGENATLRTQRDTHAAEARTARLATMSAEERALTSDLEATDGNIASLTAELDQAEAEIARLSDEPGNGAAIAKLTRAMSTTAGKLQTAEQRKEFLAGKQEELKTRATPRADTRATGEDRVLANGSKLSDYGEATQAWLLKHPKAFTDRRYMGTAVAAAIKATQAEGLEDQSAEYFSFIEKELGEGADAGDQDQGDEQDEGEEIEAEVPERRQAERYEPERPQARAAGAGSMAAAPTRQVPQGGGNRTPRKVALTASEREAADGLYGSLKNPADRYKKYAENRDFMNGREPGHFMPRN